MTFMEIHILITKITDITVIQLKYQYIAKNTENFGKHQMNTYKDMDVLFVGIKKQDCIEE